MSEAAGLKKAQCRAQWTQCMGPKARLPPELRALSVLDDRRTRRHAYQALVRPSDIRQAALDLGGSIGRRGRLHLPKAHESPPARRRGRIPYLRSLRTLALFPGHVEPCSHEEERSAPHANACDEGTVADRSAGFSRIIRRPTEASFVDPSHVRSNLPHDLVAQSCPGLQGVEPRTD